MSHTTTTYPISTRGLSLDDAAPWLVREEESEYHSFSRVLLDTIDLVSDKLPKARTVASLLLNRPHEQPEGTLVEASVIITDLIDDVMLAHKAMEAEYYREQERNRDK
jgi:hypothetical protein